MKFHTGIHIAYTGSCTDEYISFSVLCESSDGHGGQLLLVGEMCPCIVVQDNNAVIIGTDPYAMLTVLKQVASAGQSVRGIQFCKGRAVVTCDAAVSTDQYRAVAYTKDIICIRSHHAICGIIKLCHIAYVTDLLRCCIASAQWYLVRC